MSLDACGSARIAMPATGTVLIRLTWTGAPEAVRLWVRQPGQFRPMHFEGVNEVQTAVGISSDQEISTYVSDQAVLAGVRGKAAAPRSVTLHGDPASSSG